MRQGERTFDSYSRRRRLHRVHIHWSNDDAPAEPDDDVPDGGLATATTTSVAVAVTVAVADMVAAAAACSCQCQRQSELAAAALIE